MNIYLVISVLDTLYNPLSAKLVSVLASPPGQPATAQNLTPTGNTGEYEIQLPTGVTQFNFTVQQDGYFPVHQDLTLNAGPPPSLSYTSGVQELNVRNVGGHSRSGGDFNVTVAVVLGQLRDARADVDAVSSRYGMGKFGGVDPVTRPVMDFSSKTTLNASGTGWNQFDHSMQSSVTPTGKMFYAERTTVPKLIAIYVPAGITVTPSPSVDPQTKPLNFHLFYHPHPGHLQGSYPFDWAFVDLICRYLFYCRFLHKEMVNQQHAAGANPIMLFPVGDPSRWFDSLGSQAVILRLLFEVKYFVQRMAKIPYPLQPVGKCALSAFSAGGIYLHQAINNTNSYFHHNVLTEVYGFDLRQVTPAAFASRLTAWFGAGKAYRIYTTDAGWNAVHTVDSGASQSSGPGGSLEWSGASSSVVYVPFNNFWTNIWAATGRVTDFNTAPPGDYQVFRNSWDDVHQLIPAIFLEHALKNSSLK